MIPASTLRSKIALGLLVLALLGANSGCTTARPAQQAVPTPIVLERDIIQIEGWLSATGEWMVNSERDYQTYNPLGKNERDRCVSVVNDTGADRSDFAALDGKRVVVTGFAQPYEELQIGPAFADTVMSRRYFKKEFVPNFCHRELVFVAKTIQLTP